MKRCVALMLALVMAFSLTGCGVMDFMYYLFDSEDLVAQNDPEPDYQTVTAPNGLVLTYDASHWGAPVEEEGAEDTAVMSSTGSGLNQTVVMIQKGGDYQDFLEQSAAELEEVGPTVLKEMEEIDCPGATASARRYDCGSYQTILVQLDFEEGSVYVTAASKAADYTPILELVQGIQWEE